MEGHFEVPHPSALMPILAALTLILFLLGPPISVWLVYRVWRRRREASTGMKSLAMLLAAGVAAGLFGVLLGVMKAFGTIGGESIDPSQKARILAEGISEAMNFSAVSAIVVVLSAIPLAVLLGKTKRAGS